jgi:hypothetical protein
MPLAMNRDYMATFGILIIWLCSFLDLDTPPWYLPPSKRPRPAKKRSREDAADEGDPAGDKGHAQPRPGPGRPTRAGGVDSQPSFTIVESGVTWEVIEHSAAVTPPASITRELNWVVTVHTPVAANLAAPGLPRMSTLAKGTAAGVVMQAAGQPSKRGRGRPPKPASGPPAAAAAANPALQSPPSEWSTTTHAPVLSTADVDSQPAGLAQETASPSPAASQHRPLAVTARPAENDFAQDSPALGGEASRAIGAGRTRWFRGSEQ